MEVVERVLSEVHKFTASLEKKKIPASQFLFRGESECYQTVRSGLRRAFDDIVDRRSNNLDEDYIENYLTYSENFIYYQAKYFINSTNHPLLTDKNGLLTDSSLRESSGDFYTVLSEVQQRIGGTNLIDFTSDINVALFFATNFIDTSKDCRIILYAHSPSTDSDKELVMKSPIAGFSEEQSSWYIRPGSQGILDLSDEDRFEVIEIPSQDKTLISYFYLERYSNIRTTTLFKGLEGFLRSRSIGSYIAPPIMSLRAGTDISVGDYLVPGPGGKSYPTDGPGQHIVGRSLSSSKNDELFDSVMLQY